MALIYAIAWIRASLNVELVRDYLMGKRRGFGYFLGVLFGAVTPILFLLKYSALSRLHHSAHTIGHWHNHAAFLITSPLVQ